jgi:hypothetical protein
MSFFDKFRRNFPCPYCTKAVIVQATGRGAYRLIHKVPGCEIHDKPTHTNRAVLLSAFDSYCKPKRIYPNVDGLDAKGNLDPSIFKL